MIRQFDVQKNSLKLETALQPVIIKLSQNLKNVSFCKNLTEQTKSILVF